jgi:hypothetical protein
VKLNNNLRNKIVNYLVAKTFDDQNQALAKLRAEFLHRLVVGKLPEGFREATANLPEKWFVKVEYAQIGIESKSGSVKRVSLPERNHYYLLSKSVLAPRNVAENDHLVVWLNEDSPEADEALKLQQKFMSLLQEETKARSDLNSLLNSCTTYKKFQDIAPELAGIIPKTIIDVPKTPAPVPAVIVGPLIESLIKSGLKID